MGSIDSSTSEGRAAIEGLGVHVIDVSRDSVGWIGHATYASAPNVIQGIGAELGAARTEDRDKQAVLDGTAPAARDPWRDGGSGPRDSVAGAPGHCDGSRWRDAAERPGTVEHSGFGLGSARTLIKGPLVPVSAGAQHDGGQRPSNWSSPTVHGMGGLWPAFALDLRFRGR